VKKPGAEAVKNLSLRAISELTRTLVVSKDHCSDEEFKNMTWAVGSCIGHIEIDILSKVYSEYPELDDVGT
jgi:hypothetical protein